MLNLNFRYFKNSKKICVEFKNFKIENPKEEKRFERTPMFVRVRLMLLYHTYTVLEIHGKQYKVHRV